MNPDKREYLEMEWTQKKLPDRIGVKHSTNYINENNRFNITRP